MKYLLKGEREKKVITQRPGFFRLALRHWKISLFLVAYIALPPMRYGVNDFVTGTTSGFGDWWYKAEAQRKHGSFAKDWLEMKEAWCGGKSTIGAFAAMNPKEWLKYSGK